MRKPRILPLPEMTQAARRLADNKAVMVVQIPEPVSQKPVDVPCFCLPRPRAGGGDGGLIRFPHGGWLVNEDGNVFGLNFEQFKNAYV